VDVGVAPPVCTPVLRPHPYSCGMHRFFKAKKRDTESPARGHDRRSEGVKPQKHADVAGHCVLHCLKGCVSADVKPRCRIHFRSAANVCQKAPLINGIAAFINQLLKLTNIIPVFLNHKAPLRNIVLGLINHIATTHKQISLAARPMHLQTTRGPKPPHLMRLFM
jgi:hypothetical protein